MLHQRLAFVISHSTPSNSPLARGRTEIALPALALLALVGCQSSFSSPLFGANDIEFEKDIAGLIASRCLECHNAHDRQGGLTLTTRAQMLTGGESGSAVVAGKPNDSLLIERVVAGEMPPEQKGKSRKLPEHEIALFRGWIETGAKWPADRKLSLYERTSDVRAGLDWWALQPVQRPKVPGVLVKDHADNPIDAFILSNLKRHNMTMAPAADKRTLLRRAYFDLLGLPPTPEQVDSFLKDYSPGAYERLVDRLLESKHYGERWARYWLDLVRFAETCGYERDQIKPNIWRYRDWVINALNDDMPYDRFVTDQLAGDEVAWRDEQSVVATGMLRAGTWNDEPNDAADYLYERLQDMVHTTSSTFLGLTVKCARCHDHKFDPIRQTDYYRMASFFWSGYIGQANLGGPNKEQLGFDVFGWTDKARTAQPIHLLHKGERHRPGSIVEPGFLSAVATLDRPLRQAPNDSKTTHRRLQLAQWITDPKNPLTARVFVNRLWQHHFGEAIVRTPNNLGFKSDPPTHPQLLDWLAAEFVTGGWKIKRLHKLIMMSRTYRQASVHPQQIAYSEQDFLNRRWWRRNRRRLDAEAMRDSMLAVSGQLNKEMGGPSFYPRMSDEALEGLSRKNAAWKTSPLKPRSRRSIYMMTKRQRLLPLMTAFDFCDTTQPCGQRDVTTVAPQALALLNNQFVHGQSEALARRLMQEANTDSARIELAWRLAFGRSPSKEENQFATEHVNSQLAQFRGRGTPPVGSVRDAAKDLTVTKELELWLRADQGITLDESRRVIAWQDLSASGRGDAHAHDASQANANARPLLIADAVHHQPALRFNGENQFMNLAGQVVWSQQFTIVAVVNHLAKDQLREVISNWHSRSGNSTTSIFLGTNGPTGVRLSDGFNPAGTLSEPSRHFILTGVSGAADATTYQNGRRLASKGTPLPQRALNSPYVLGVQGNYQREYWKGDIAEILVYDRELSEPELRQVWDYLSLRYGINSEFKPSDAHLLALASLCHVLLNTNEFIYVD